MSKITIGEAIVRRKLKLRNPKIAVKYQSGQGKVSKLSDEDAIVSYVTASGDLTILPVELVNDEWFHRGMAITADALTAEVRNIPRQTPLRGNVVTLLRAAYHKEEAPPPSDTNGEGTSTTEPGE